MSLVKQRVYLSFFASVGLRDGDPTLPGQYRPMLFRMKALQMRRKVLEMVGLGSRLQ